MDYRIPSTLQCRPVILRITTHILCLHISIRRVFLVNDRKRFHTCPLHSHSSHIIRYIFLIQKSADVIGVRIIDCSHPYLRIQRIFFKLRSQILSHENGQVLCSPRTRRPARCPCYFILRHEHRNSNPIFFISLHIFGEIKRVCLQISLLHLESRNISQYITGRIKTVVPDIGALNAGTFLRIMLVDFHPCRRSPGRSPHLQIGT